MSPAPAAADPGPLNESERTIVSLCRRLATATAKLEVAQTKETKAKADVATALAEVDDLRAQLRVMVT